MPMASKVKKRNLSRSFENSDKYLAIEIFRFLYVSMKIQSVLYGKRISNTSV
jgi:hypothetical protein